MTPTVSPEIKSACITIAPALGQDINLATAALGKGSQRQWTCASCDLPGLPYWHYWKHSAKDGGIVVFYPSHLASMAHAKWWLGECVLMVVARGDGGTPANTPGHCSA